MPRQTRWVVPLIGLLLTLTSSTSASAQVKEKVYTVLSPAQIEKTLSDMGIRFTKTQPPKVPKDWDFDFDRNNYKIRLTLGNGKLLWLTAFFPKSTLEKINQWNINAKFSRAVLDRVDDREYAIVEYQLDANGGVTENMIRQFIQRFDSEVSAFDQFLRKD